MLGNEALEKAPNTNVCFVILEQLIINSFPTHDQEEVSVSEMTSPSCVHASTHLCCVISCFLRISAPGLGAVLWKTEAGRSQKVQGQPALHSEFQASQGYLAKPCLKKQTSKRTKTVSPIYNFAFNLPALLLTGFLG